MDQTKRAKLKHVFVINKKPIIVIGLVFISMLVLSWVVIIRNRAPNIGPEWTYSGEFNLSGGFMSFEDSPDLSAYSYQTNLSAQEAHDFIAQRSGATESSDESTVEKDGLETIYWHFYPYRVSYYISLDTPAKKAAYERINHEPSGYVTHSAIVSIPKPLAKKIAENY